MPCMNSSERAGNVIYPVFLYTPRQHGRNPHCHAPLTPINLTLDNISYAMTLLYWRETTVIQLYSHRDGKGWRVDVNSSQGFLPHRALSGSPLRDLPPITERLRQMYPAHAILPIQVC